MDSHHVQVIGIDWAATQETNCGLALGHVRDGVVEVEELLTGHQAAGRRSAPHVAAWLRRFPNAIVAIDAPLGWPATLAIAVSTHVAGEPLGTSADAPTFFSRETDRFVQRTFKKTPLSVGADLIARTAFSALCLVSELRELTGLPLRLAWASEDRGVIEVYPAATLKAIADAKKVPSYKKPSDRDARREIVEMLLPVVRLEPSQLERAIASDHLLDAVVCVVAGADFASARAWPPPPELRERATREGWIWVRRATSHDRDRLDR